MVLTKKIDFLLVWFYSMEKIKHTHTSQFPSPFAAAVLFSSFLLALLNLLKSFLMMIYNPGTFIQELNLKQTSPSRLLKTWFALDSNSW